MAGLNDEESDDLLKVVNGILEDTELGCRILTIYHDLRLIMRLCDSVHVLDEGKTIAEGLLNDVRHNSAVVNSYIGNFKNIDYVHSKMLPSKPLASSYLKRK